MGLDGLTTLAASSGDFALRAAGQLTLNLRRESGQPDGAVVEPETSSFFYIASGPPPVGGLAGSLETRILPFEAPAGSGIWFRGVTNGRDQIVAVDILYATEPKLAAEFATFVKSSMRLSTVESSGPLEFFGRIWAGADLEAGYMLGAARLFQGG